MSKTCNIVKDLIPLYIENMVSDESRIMVERHIKFCPECKNILNEMQSFDEIPADKDSTPLRKIESTLRKKKAQTIILSVLVSLVVFVIAFSFLTAPEFHRYNEGSVSLQDIGDGLVLLQFKNTVAGYDIHSYPAEDGSGYVYHITTWNNIWNRMFKTSKAKNTVLNPNGEAIAAVYYYQADGSADRLKFGTNLYPDGGVVTLPRLFLSYYAFAAFVFAAFCGMVMIVFYRNKKVLQFALKIFLLPVSYLIGHFAIKGFSSSSYTATRDFFAILLVTIPLYMALLIVLNIILRRYEAKKKETA